MKKQTMNKDNRYWDIHKEVYTDELDELDPEIRNTVLTKPLSREAKLFNDKIDKVIETKLKENPKVAG